MGRRNRVVSKYTHGMSSPASSREAEELDNACIETDTCISFSSGWQRGRLPSDRCFATEGFMVDVPGKGLKKSWRSAIRNLHAVEPRVLASASHRLLTPACSLNPFHSFPLERDPGGLEQQHVLIGQVVYDRTSKRVHAGSIRVRIQPLALPIDIESPLAPLPLESLLDTNSGAIEGETSPVMRNMRRVRRKTFSRGHPAASGEQDLGRHHHSQRSATLSKDLKDGLTTCSIVISFETELLAPRKTLHNNRDNKRQWGVEKKNLQATRWGGDGEEDLMLAEPDSDTMKLAAGPWTAWKEDGDSLESGLVEVQQDRLCTAMRVDIPVILLAVVGAKRMHHGGRSSTARRCCLKRLGVSNREGWRYPNEDGWFNVLTAILKEARGQDDWPGKLSENVAPQNDRRAQGPIFRCNGWRDGSRSVDIMQSRRPSKYAQSYPRLSTFSNTAPRPGGLTTMALINLTPKGHPEAAQPSATNASRQPETGLFPPRRSGTSILMCGIHRRIGRLLLQTLQLIGVPAGFTADNAVAKSPLDVGEHRPLDRKLSTRVRAKLRLQRFNKLKPRLIPILDPSPQVKKNVS
ncbi:hypothetical protein BKA70DRAFT_1396014 [Coprinopsis sp. MPI-PUGE-AT-0042]|nr:hypothetical protein BKA70DRAFT_1396014 [Coprinopsis sp. MPI-PUGE-AT-0042]